MNRLLTESPRLLNGTSTCPKKGRSTSIDVLTARWPAPVWTAIGVLAAAAFATVGLLGAYHYVDNYWLYRGFLPPQDPAYVTTRGTAVRMDVASLALDHLEQPRAA